MKIAPTGLDVALFSVVMLVDGLPGGTDVEVVATIPADPFGAPVLCGGWSAGVGSGPGGCPVGDGAEVGTGVGGTVDVGGGVVTVVVLVEVTVVVVVDGGGGGGVVVGGGGGGVGVIVGVGVGESVGDGGSVGVTWSTRTSSSAITR